MSFSSSSLHSSSVCSSTDVDSTGASVQSGWASELDGRILLSDLPLEDYLDELVPCSSPYESANLTIDANAFSDYEPGDGLEVKSTPHVRNGLASLVADFDDDIRLSFWDSHSGDYRFPLSPFATNHAKSSPDISVSFPGASDDVEARSSRWEVISMWVEAKDTEKGDPFLHHKSGATNADTIIQLARNARTLMLVHGFLYSFVLGIYGDIVRIARFDRTVCIVGRPFNLRHNLHILQRFFWHYTHPIIGSPVVGCDPTIRPLTIKENTWLQKHLARACVERTDMDVFMTRRVEVHNDHDGTVVPYFVYQVVDVNSRLMSRSTIVWRAIKDTYAEDQHARNVVKPCILKESWRHLVRRPETVFYRRMASTISEEERWGLPRLLAGGDIGQLELRTWELCSPHAIDLAYERHLRLPMSPFPAASTYRYPPSCPLPWPQHQTVTWAINMTSKYTYCERSHMRFVTEEVGRPLTDFRDTKELVTAMRDAIIGHRLACNKAGILHRDVNLGNILIVDEPSPDGPFGFLHDFDYSYITDVAPGHESAPAPSNIDSTELKERTGTRYFMSCEILKGNPGLIHRVYHDLESFYWVLVWIVLRYTRQNLGKAMSELVFEYDIDAALQKKLMSKFKSLVAKMLTSHYKDNHLTHEAVLQLFDDALAQTGWPEEDRVECIRLDSQSQQDDAERLRKPSPEIRRIVAHEFSILKKRCATVAGLDVPPSIPEESTGTDAGPSTETEDRTSSKRFKYEVSTCGSHGASSLASRPPGNTVGLAEEE